MKVKVILSMPWTDEEGTVYQGGDTIEVSLLTSRVLIFRGLARLAPVKTATRKREEA